MGDRIRWLWLPVGVALAARNLNADNWKPIAAMLLIGVAATLVESFMARQREAAS